MLFRSPMSKNQHEISEVYKKVKQVYDLAHSTWKANKSKDKGEEPQAPPPMLDLYFSNFTIEALVDSIQHHPDNGYLIFNDELAQFYKSLDAYRGGKGGDRQQWLTIWDAGGIKNNRKSSGSIFIPQVSISILGGVQPQTIRNMISGDDSNLDGLWHRFSFVGLHETSIDPFTEVTGDLTDELDKIYTALSEQAHQTYWLSFDAKPLWAKWHYEMQSKRLSATQEMLKGVYPKFAGIAGRNALILHCTYAAIAGTVPDQLIPASTIETAIAWTKWELSQTLLQYQLLGLTDDPDLSRALKLIDQFKGKGWFNARDISRKVPANELRIIMAKVVGLGYAIDNGESKDSSGYKIQILKSGDIGDKPPETVIQQQENLSPPTETKLSANSIESSNSNGLEFVISGGDKVTNGNGKGDISSVAPVVSTFVPKGGDRPETAVSSDLSIHNDNFVSVRGDSIKAIHSNVSSELVTNVSTFERDKNLKVGDRVQWGDIDLIPDATEEEFQSADSWGER